MNFSLRNLALGAALVASSAMFAQATEGTVIFSEDFEWLYPDWVEWVSADGTSGPAQDTVGTDGAEATAPQLGTSYTGSISEGTSVTTYQALVNKGYNFYAWNASTKTARAPQNQIYLQKTYLKFGLTAYQSGMGILMPKAATNAVIDFDFCSMRQGSGKWDPTKLVVVVKNGELEQQFLVPFMEYADNEAFSWKHVSLPLTDATIEAGTELIIRNIDEQLHSTSALRWFMDNIVVKGDVVKTATDYDMLWSEDFEWFGEEHGEEHRSFSNCPSKAGDTVGSNGSDSNCNNLLSAYYGAVGAGTAVTAYAALVEKGYNLYNTTAPDRTAREVGKDIYVQTNYLKFGLTGRYAGIGFVPGKVVENAHLTFDWCPHRETDTQNQYVGGQFDPVKLVVVVKNGNNEQQFAVPEVVRENGSEYSWAPAEIALTGAKIGKNTEIIIRPVDEQWPLTELWNGTAAYAMRWYLDNVKLYGEEMPFTGEVTADWKVKYNPTGLDVRSGCAANGKFYFTENQKLYCVDGTVDADGKAVIQTLATLPEGVSSFNKGLTVDDAGNVLLNTPWPTSAVTGLGTWYLLRNGATELEKVEVEIEGWDQARSDQFGRAVGDFTSEEGGIFFITAQNNLKPYPVHIANGQFVEAYFTGDVEMPVPTNMDYCVPAFNKVAEVEDFDELGNMFFWSTKDSKTVEYVGLDDEGNKVKKAFANIPAASFPEGWGYKPQFGFDAINLAGHNYKAQRVGNGNWDTNFAVSDENGNMLFMSDFSGDENKHSTTNGSVIVMRKVAYDKAEIYVQAAGPAANVENFVAKYTLEVPVPAIYIAGQFQNWDPVNAAEFTYEGNGLYTFEFDQPGGGFKISTVKGGWDAFNTGLLGTDPHTLAVGETYDLIAGYDGDYQLGKGHYTLTLDMDAMTISVDGEADAEVPELYLRGEFNGWGATDASKFTAPEEFNADGYAVYTLEMAELEGEVKIATAPEWTINMGGVNIPSAGTYTLALNGNNMAVTKMKNVKMTLAYPKNINDAITLAVECDQYVARKAFAYDLNATNENGAYTVSYKLSAPAKAVELVLTDAAGNQTTQTLTGVAAGENTAAIDTPAEGEYTWALNVTSESEANEMAYAYKAPKEFKGENTHRGGVVWMNDPEYDSYGYTVVGHGCAKGFEVYNPAGELMYDGLIHAGYEKLDAANGSSVHRGDCLRDKAVFGDWSDKASGAWVIDPLNPTAEPWNMIMPEGAEQASSGAVTYNGVQTASGTPVVAFQGKGEDTKMFMFDEDIYGNTLVRYDLGTADYVMAAPTLVMSGVKGKMANTNIAVEPIETGFFVSQCRADKNDANVPGLMFFDNEGELVWDSGNKGLEQPDMGSGVAVSPDGKLIALTSYDAIYVYDLSFNDFDEPVVGTVDGETLKAKYVFSMPRAHGSYSGGYQHMHFDAAFNLHVFDRLNYGYRVVVLPGETTANTPAKAANVIKVESGVENIAVDANAAVEYFNLNGIAVDADNLTPGIYIRRQGNVATKVIVK